MKAFLSKVAEGEEVEIINAFFIFMLKYGIPNL